MSEICVRVFVLLDPTTRLLNFGNFQLRPYRRPTCVAVQRNLVGKMRGQILPQDDGLVPVSRFEFTDELSLKY